MNNSLFSKYIAANTIIHNLDPRVKLIGTIVYLINIFIARTIAEFIILFIFLFVVEYLAQINLKYLLSGFKSILFIVFFTGIIHIIFNKSGDIILTISSFNLYSGAIYNIILICIRFFLVVAIMIIFMITTSPTELMSSVDKGLEPLNKLGINVATFSLLLSISIRFIPTIGEETNRIINAQVSRGANIRASGIIEKVKNFIPILIPIFIATLKRADELATAMEVRGYNPDMKRTKYRKLEYTNYDYLGYFIILLLTLFIVI
ncbi:energy-coupling factor transporter transmembrane protein EcfT [Gemella sp. GH3]|uniref:energy-coupling factor transporter transmembrane component T family protein n=1 Tax=unclassified Gemella TaxID=2624949 RepID=UPI0015D0BF49|nr:MULTISPECIES: energy-coupling factor transporter transmembrane component T [unclassified Gemella]MBF0713195.1 energy-coupling factor transporter transmembrane protein EcfT [Gemella sp. GH3.1]NYS50147.1 energy-coupling factor transporter transmembrane protein EcfT [Gemella sp. GH3]